VCVECFKELAVGDRADRDTGGEEGQSEEERADGFELAVAVGVV